MQLSPRAGQIIRILTRFAPNQPVTTAAISEELGLSRRSVLRELPAAETWLARRGFCLIRKPGSGLLLDETPERRQALLTMLGEGGGLADSRIQRQKLLRRELLAAKEPVKAYSLAEKLGVSEGTLSTDLDQTAKWLERYRLCLIRRPGLGIFIAGSEPAKRQAISAVVCEQFDEQQLFTLLRGNRSAALPIRSQFLDRIDADVVRQVEQILEECEQKLGIRFSDSSFISLFVHISLAVQRLRVGETIALEPDRLQKLRILPEYAAAERIVHRLGRALHMHIPADEAGFIAMHLSGARLLPGSRHDLTQADAIHVRKTALAMMQTAGKMLKTDFGADTILLEDLCNHLSPAIGRLQADIPIENPQLDDLQADYPEVYAACAQAAEVLRSFHDIRHIPASEIGFIAMHFGAAVERRHNLLRRVAAVIVCPTGIGTSRLLAAGLQRDFPHLDVRGIMSAFALNPDKLHKDGIELIISTTPLDTSFRYLQVNPILTTQDKLLLGTELGLLQKRDAAPPQAASPQMLSREDVASISLLGQEIYALLDDLRIRKAPVLQTSAGLIDQAAALFAHDAASCAGLKQVFEARNKLANTYIKPFHALLLHGRTALTAHARFGYVRLDPPIYEHGRVILGAVVMLIPDDARSEICAKIMSEISGLLLENPVLLDILRKGSAADLAQLLEGMLLQFYRRSVQTRLNPAQ